jgi:hypothetical protein
MTKGLPDLVRLTKADLESAAEVAARAFRNYPLMIYFHPDPSFSGHRYGTVCSMVRSTLPPRT